MALDPDQLHDQIRRFLLSQEPQLIRLLYGAWDKQAGVITYTDLARAARTGKLTPETLGKWQLIYNNFVLTKMVPLWENAALNGFNTANFQLSLFDVPPVGWDAFRVRLDKWVRTRGGQLITNLDKTQAKAVNQLLQWHIAHEPLTPTELGIRLRSTIGLTAREEQAVRRRLQLLLDTDGLSRADAMQQSARYAGYLHRVRATRIARTELVFAYSQAQQDTMLAAIDEGLIDDVTKCWQTAEDERVCKTCFGLNEECVDINEEFHSLGKSAQAPPIHPSCRCVLLYEIAD